MARNIEIKAKVSDPSRVAAIAATLSGSPPQRLKQIDTFFHISHGRLKLRVLSERHAELIYYKRNDDFGPKQSRYRRLPVWFPKLANLLLSFLLSTKGKVVKDRFVYLVGQTRIHLDYVESLGNFIELEVVLKPTQSSADGVTTALQLMKELDILESDLIDLSYIDLLVKETTVH